MKKNLDKEEAKEALRMMLLGVIRVLRLNPLEGLEDQIRKRSRNSWDLIACAFGYISLYYVKYIRNEPYITSFQMREKWMEELLDGYEKRCSNMFRMTQSTFHQLCMDLKRKYGLLP
ncbi:hypothetical protein Godav_027569 [Gossypium davidsonii]|uniref:DUF8040 domain-containing protein n=1 Tax=Gossypium davidsonii TaxID=34287 RepID=A0A7J8RXW7_GOSDV|nr:hypothetical protein [Gossypium davidsonii]